MPALRVQESGFAREYISDECLMPAHSARRWMTCNVVKEEKTAFRMYLDDSHSRFLLSAKRIGDCFYISQYEAFPEVRHARQRKTKGRGGKQGAEMRGRTSSRTSDGQRTLKPAYCVPSATLEASIVRLTGVCALCVGAERGGGARLLLLRRPQVRHMGLHLS